MDPHDDAEPTSHEDHVDNEMLDEVLTVLGDDVPEGLLRACDLFRSSVPTRMDDIGVAIAGGRFGEVAAAAHSLRGSAGAFGARRLSHLADQLERLSHQDDRSAAAGLLEDMRAEFVVFRAILDARLAELTG